MHQPIQSQSAPNSNNVSQVMVRFLGAIPALSMPLRKTITNTLTETTDLVHGHSVVSEKFSNFLRTSAGNSVRYEAVNAMLLNEFLKAHRRIEEQEGTIARLQKQIDAVTAGLQKVSAQLEVSKPPLQTLLKDH